MSPSSFFLLQVGIWGKRFIDSYLKHYRETHLIEDAAGVTTVHALGVVSKIVLYTMVFLLILENLGVDVTALITGLGIVGVAVALAAQNLLKDFFSAIIIVLDKPFVVGDFIVVSEISGTVEHVGIKTTHIRSLGGEQIVLCNSQLLEGKVQNFKRMKSRRIVFSLGVTYDTSSEKLKRIPELIMEVFEGQEKTTFDRAHFKSFGDFSLNFEVVYHVMDKDYNLYMDIQESINLELYRRFTQEGIDFAFPTQTLYVEKAGNPTPSSLSTN